MTSRAGIVFIILRCIKNPHKMNVTSSGKGIPIPPRISMAKSAM